MSIRTLTTQLQQETVEQQRVQQFQSVRSIQQPKEQQETSKQTPFMVGASSRKPIQENTPVELPVQQPTTPKIGLKEREKETAYDVPGGIVARFGKNALKEPVLPKEPDEIVIPEPVLETPQEKEADESHTEETAHPQEQEQAAETEDEAARITIELQSH